MNIERPIGRIHPLPIFPPIEIDPEPIGIQNMTISISKIPIRRINSVPLSNLSGTNTGDETSTTIKSKLGISTLSGSNTGDQDLSSYATKNSAPNNQTIAYTLQTSDNGGVVTVNSATGVNVTVPTALTAGFNCLVLQLGAGQVTFVGSGGMTINEPDSKTKTAKIYAGVSVYVDATNNCILSGYTS